MRKHKTLIAHIYNEEYLLPWWLEHHKKIFDHGIILDHFSTDKTVEHINTICPTWEVRQAKHKEVFTAETLYDDFMAVEEEVKGWRMILNATEFLVGDFTFLDTCNENQLIVPSVVFVDTEPENNPTYQSQIFEQKHHGLRLSHGIVERKCRSIHNTTHRYKSIGRHFDHYNTFKLAVFYFQWCPLNEKNINRRLQIRDKIPENKKGCSHLTTHMFNREQLLNKINTQLIPKTQDISNYINYYYGMHKQALSAEDYKF